MKKRILILFTILLLPSVVSAHPGRLNSSGCHTCNTNCSDWGLKAGQYHCHKNGDYSNYYIPSSNSNNSNNSNSSSSNTTIKKSSDNTLKKVVVNDEVLTISNNMTYSTESETVKINVETNHSKATYKLTGDTNLSAGENIFEIKVTAQNGSTKTYKLTITRKLSNNTNIKIIINNEEIKFVDKKATIDVSADTEKVEYDYELEDKNAKVSVEDVKTLKEGENLFKFIVTAEDGTTAIYEITVNKEQNVEQSENETSEDPVVDFIAGLMALGFFGGIGGGLAYLTNKKKK